MINNMSLRNIKSKIAQGSLMTLNWKDIAYLALVELELAEADKTELFLRLRKAEIYAQLANTMKNRD